MFIDRRHLTTQRRHSFRVSAVFAVKSVVGTRVMLGQAEDVGLAGMTFRRPKGSSLALQSPVMLMFELPGVFGELAARGVVVSDVRSGNFRRTGVRFTALCPEDERLLAEFCHRNGVDIGGELQAASQVA